VESWGIDRCCYTQRRSSRKGSLHALQVAVAAPRTWREERRPQRRAVGERREEDEDEDEEQLAGRTAILVLLGPQRFNADRSRSQFDLTRRQGSQAGGSESRFETGGGALCGGGDGVDDDGEERRRTGEVVGQAKVRAGYGPMYAEGRAETLSLFVAVYVSR
jgi:hypothetical protein